MFPVLPSATLPKVAAPTFDWGALPKLDDTPSFTTTPIVTPPPVAVVPKMPSPTMLQPLPVHSAPSPLRKSLDKPPQMRPVTPTALQMLEVDDTTSLSEEDSRPSEPAWEPAVEDTPISEEPEEPPGPSLEERLEEYLAAKRHDLASRAFYAWRGWATDRAYERRAVERAAKRAIRGRPIRLMSPKTVSKQGPIDYDYYINTQQRQEAFQKILASLRQRVSNIT